jgi:hypothetical protein
MTTENPEGTNTPSAAAVACTDWLAAFCRYHASYYFLHASQEEAEAEMKAGENEGECYGVATYHIPTKTLHMRDPLNASDPAKVRASIEAWLSGNVLAQARGASEPGRKVGRDPALPEANGSPMKSLPAYSLSE